MPHFVIECPENILENNSPKEIMLTVFNAAASTGLFDVKDIKVRIQPYAHFLLAEGKKDFLHVFGNIMEGRTTEQKAALSKKIIAALSELIPEISFLSININDFEKATYYNKALLNPENTGGNRHYGI